MAGHCQRIHSHASKLVWPVLLVLTGPKRQHTCRHSPVLGVCLYLTKYVINLFRSRYHIITTRLVSQFQLNATLWYYCEIATTPGRRKVDARIRSSSTSLSYKAVPDIFDFFSLRFCFPFPPYSRRWPVSRQSGRVPFELMGHCSLRCLLRDSEWNQRLLQSLNPGKWSIEEVVTANCSLN